MAMILSQQFLELICVAILAPGTGDRWREIFTVGAKYSMVLQ